MSAMITVNTIAPFVPNASKPWNAQRIQHLYSRLGYGASLEDIQFGLNTSPENLVDNILDAVLSMATPEVPEWANWTYEDYNEDDDLYFEHQAEISTRWVKEMGLSSQHFRSKLAIFWHSHFVAEQEVYDCPSYMWAYYNLLHNSVLGNFRTFVEDMGRNPAMLIA